MPNRHPSSQLSMAMLATFGALLCPTIAQAQITPTIAGDPGATGTIVTPTDTTFDITGGQTAGNNLFHSFSQFGLNQGQIANFQTDAAIQNVLARVNGGDPSVINGLLRLSGANANLYLMNPAGVLFGANSSVNLPASFIVTTSPHIGIQSPDRLLTNEFNAIGNNDYATLAGTPYRFRFPTGATGSIANLSDLTGLAFPLSETRTDFTGAGFVPILNPNVTPGLRSGGDNAIAFIGNTVFSPKPIFTTGTNVVGVAAAENSTVVFGGPQTTVGNPIDAAIVTNDPATPNLPFNAFAIPSLADLVVPRIGEANLETIDSSTVVSAGNGQLTYTIRPTLITGTALSTTVQPGDVVISRIYNHNAASTKPNQGNVLLKASGNVVTGDIYGGESQSVQIDAGKNILNRSYISGGDVKLAAIGDIDAGALSSRNGSLQLRSLGATTVKSMLALVPGNAVSTTAGNIDVQATTLKVTEFANLPLRWLKEKTIVPPERSGDIYPLKPVSIAATGSIQIPKGTDFIEGANLKRDASGQIIYGLAPDLARPVTITGVNAADGRLVVTDRATGERLTTQQVFVEAIVPRTPGSELTTAGTAGLIIRLTPQTLTPTEISGAPIPTIPPNGTPPVVVEPPMTISPNPGPSPQPGIESPLEPDSSSAPLSILRPYGSDLSAVAFRRKSQMELPVEAPISLGVLKVKLPEPEEGKLKIRQ